MRLEWEQKGMELTANGVIPSVYGTELIASEMKPEVCSMELAKSRMNWEAKKIGLKARGMLLTA
jgi:hypothetical protein